MNLVLIHCPKTGGASLRAAFPWACREHATLTERWLEMNRKERECSFFAAFVRDPWARLFSWWRHANYFYKWTFEEYVLHHAVGEIYVHGRKRTGLLVAKQEQWVESPYRRLDFVGRFETLEKDFTNLLAILGLPIDQRLPHLHCSEHRQAHPYHEGRWTAQMLNVVRSTFEPFAGKYGYEEPKNEEG